MKQCLAKKILFALLATSLQAAGVAAIKPNILFILADDLGYGDVHCLNPERGKIATPNLDKLAAEGMRFTDAHSSSAVCTPSRYSILTGRYNWRSRLQRGIVTVYGSPLIPKERLTVAGLLKQQGYATACIGKWHLGWHWPRQGAKIDFTQSIKDGPTTLGFDYYFGTDVPNYPPYCFIENDHTVGIPSAPLPKRLLGHNLASVPGLALPGWSLEAILPTITDKACEFISAQAKAGKPFFLYLPLTSPHTPLAVSAEWLGRSKLGRYADYVMETDAMIGRVLKAVEASGVAKNTLVMLASDNGCAPYIGVDDLERQGHFPSADRRGYKADIWDGGHRIPLLVRWPGKVKADSSNGQLVSLVDFMATCADILGVKLPANAGEDSVSLLPAMLGTATAPLHEAVVFHSINGSFAIQQGRWKLELCPDSGGWSAPKPGSKEAQSLPPVQLYDMKKDVGERVNECSSHPEVVARLTKLLEKYVAAGRSTLGKPQTNDVVVNIRKGRTFDQ
jgi:arylsulfatase A